ncbi:MAG: FKBP-type peptidyl-prolyl cis-trans isomerase N-terminal domain-containing protein, partial [bacterium]
MSQKELQAASEALSARMQSRADEQMKVRIIEGEENLAKAKAFLIEHQKKDGVQTLKSGLQYVILKKGQGKTPGQTSVVRVHYEGKLL